MADQTSTDPYDPTIPAEDDAWYGVCRWCDGVLHWRPSTEVGWHHADSTEAADCADARGDLLIVGIPYPGPGSVR